MLLFRVTLSILLLSLNNGCSPRENSSYTYPNILFIAIDDLRPELGCYGVSEVYSPNIDRLARQGTVFTRAYCQMSWCSPSRTSLMTGLYPHHTEVLDLQTHFRSTIPSITTLPQHFKESGYTALSFGKVYHNSQELQDSLSWSVPAWLPDHPNPIQAYALKSNQKIAQSNPYHKATATEQARVPDTAYPDGQTTVQAIKAMQHLAQSPRPFFLAVGYYKPHLPFTAPAQYWNHYQPEEIELSLLKELPEGSPPYLFREWSEPGSYLNVPKQEPFPDSLSTHLKLAYYASITFIDAQIGQLLHNLERLGLAENTIVVLWGDHGFKLGEYGRWSKHSTMEIDTKVPLILSVPGARENRNRVDGILELVDLFPTLCDLAQIPYPDQPSDGKSFANFITNPQVVGKESAYSTIIHEGRQSHSLRSNQYRFSAWYDHDHPTEPLAIELYDLASNSLETKNLANTPEYQTVVNHFLQKLQQDYELP